MKFQIIPYFVFPGNAMDAIRYYEEIFAVKAWVSTYGEWPNEFDQQVPDEIADKVMHAAIETEQFSLYFSDAESSDDVRIGNQISLTLSVDTLADAEFFYDKLSPEADIISPLAPTTYSDGYAYLIDNLQIPWQIIADKTEE